MDALALNRLEQDPGWRDLLAAYTPSTDTPAPPAGGDGETGTEGDDERLAGWLPRIDTLEDVKSEHLPRLHGRLIAFGLLEFQLTSMTTGVVYRLTSRGRALLADEPAVDEVDSLEDDGDDSDDVLANAA